jgi:hypothetical protein
LERLPLAGIEVSRQQAQKKICWHFVHALLELAVWLQAGEDRAIAAGSKDPLGISEQRFTATKNKSILALTGRRSNAATELMTCECA